MARKKETWFELLAACPWWVSVGLSVSVFAFFRSILPHMSIQAHDALQEILFTALQKNGYLFAPYLAFLLLLPLPFSLLNSRDRKRSLDSQTGLDSIRKLDWRKFEQLVGEAFHRQGYLVTETGQGGADGGIDLRLRKGTEVFLVQCKQWRVYKVSVNVVRELYGVMAAEDAAGGIVITSGSFTEDAKDFASGRNIELIDGPRLEKMIASVQTVPRTQQPVSVTKDAIPECPKCNSPMVKRTAKQGANAGGQFWGCSKFPDCRGIRSIS